MLAENVFVTTMEPPKAFKKVNDLLRPGGFAPAEGDGVSTVTWKRGPAKPGHRSIMKLPMRLRMDYDRARVTLALVIDEPGRPDKAVAAFGLALLNAAQAHLTPGADVTAAAAPIREAELALRRSHRRSSVLIGTILVVFIGLIALAIWYTLSHF